MSDIARHAWKPGPKERPEQSGRAVKFSGSRPINAHMTTSPRRRERGLSHESGFTIVEGVIATAILVIGLLGALTMLTGALRGTSANNARVGATNLSRELVEAVRGLSYDDMTSGLVTARLQARGFGSGTPWTIERRGVRYTLAATSCTFDDPADGIASAPPTQLCTPAATGTTGDPNGEDFRRTTFAISWNEPGGNARLLRQTTLVVNPSGGLGPRITSFTPITQSVTSSTQNTASIVWTTTPASTLKWSADDGRSTSSGSVTGSNSFTTVWDLGTSGTGSEILDGSYQVTAQPFDDRDIAGEAKRANVVINRRQPYPPPTLLGGKNTLFGDPIVELEWSLNNERDVLGYRVMWGGPDGIAGGGNDEQVCPWPTQGTMLPATATSCIHWWPPSGSTFYYIVAIDRDRFNVPRDGDRRGLAVGPASARPAKPTLPLTVTTQDSRPVLSWGAPATGPAPSFYRIYRDGVRYDRTADASTTFTDSSAGTVTHDYWITAVDSTFNESDPIGPVTWTP